MFAPFVASLLVAAGQPANPLLNELLEKGLPLPQGQTVRFAPPLMADGLSKEQQQAVLLKVADKRPLDLFLKKTDAAPFHYKITSIEDRAGKRVGQTVDLAFIAYGSLDRVVKEDVLNQLIGTEAKKAKDVDNVKVLSPDVLAKRGIKLLDGTNVEERYAGLDIFLLEKVKITGITRNVKAHGPDSVALAMMLDPRFADDKDYPNRWRPYDPLAEKDKAFGPPQPYTGMGGYARVTKLIEPEGALFFEVHTAFHEPEGWFGGPNLLRSKLPIVLQENVRNLRRKLGR